MEYDLYWAADRGDLDEVRALLAAHPDILTNWGTVHGDYGAEQDETPLHAACMQGHREVVEALLVHPGVDVNRRDGLGKTAFFYACWNDRVGVVELMLGDPRVDANLADNIGDTPLFIAAYGGSLGVIERMIASGREIDWERTGEAHDDIWTSLEIADETGYYEIVDLLHRLRVDPGRTRDSLRVKFGMTSELVAGLFASTVFLCDGLLSRHPGATATSRGRFFSVVERLPLELQMVICNRVYGSPRNSVLSRHSEPAFRHLVRYLDADGL